MCLINSNITETENKEVKRNSDITSLIVDTSMYLLPKNVSLSEYKSILKYLFVILCSELL